MKRGARSSSAYSEVGLELQEFGEEEKNHGIVTGRMEKQDCGTSAVGLPGSVSVHLREKMDQEQRDASTSKSNCKHHP